MDNSSFCYASFKPNTEGIMAVKCDLREKKCTDSTLLSNLDFAESVFRNHPMNCSSNLIVKGDFSYVQIGNDKDKVFTITSENNKTYLNLAIHNNRITNIKQYIVEAHHFFAHSCQDEIKPCFVQAKEAITDDSVKLLQIICNRFLVIYTSSFSNLAKTVETKCQFKLETITVEGLLEKKIWLQKEKATCHGLIACLDHLIKLYLTTSDAPKNNCRFIIHADKEIIRILSSGEQQEREYVLLYDDCTVSMFPPAWQ